MGRSFHTLLAAEISTWLLRPRPPLSVTAVAPRFSTLDRGALFRTADAPANFPTPLPLPQFLIFALLTARDRSRLAEQSRQRDSSLANWNWKQISGFPRGKRDSSRNGRIRTIPSRFQIQVAACAACRCRRAKIGAKRERSSIKTRGIRPINERLCYSIASVVVRERDREERGDSESWPPASRVPHSVELAF